MSGFPVANRREARKLGLLRSKSSEAERERMELQERNERVCGEKSDTDARPLYILYSTIHAILPLSRITTYDSRLTVVIPFRSAS